MPGYGNSMGAISFCGRTVVTRDTNSDNIKNRVEDMIDVYFIGLEDEPKNGYYERNINEVAGAIEALDHDTTGFVIRKLKMTKEKFESLPEFMGF